MRVKVICGVLVYSAGTYHEGDYVEVENGAERQMLIQERCVVESQAVEKKIPPNSAIKAKGRTKGK